VEEPEFSNDDLIQFIPKASASERVESTDTPSTVVTFEYFIAPLSCTPEVAGLKINEG